KRLSFYAEMPDARSPLDMLAPIRKHSQMTWELQPSTRTSYDQAFVDPLPGVWTFWFTPDNGWSPTTYDPTETHPARATEFTLRATAIRLDSRSTSDQRGRAT